jgi:hypothetical protein
MGSSFYLAALVSGVLPPLEELSIANPAQSLGDKIIPPHRPSQSAFTGVHLRLKMNSKFLVGFHVRHRYISEYGGK